MFARFLLIGAFALPLALATAAPASAQTMDPRVAQLEEQVRQLNGLVEELNFQLLQMQDQLRRMQEDNEMRFQELEQRRSDASGARPSDHAASGAPARTEPDVAGSGDGEFYGGAQASTPGAQGAQAHGEPPRDLGAITFDADGTPRSSQPAAPSNDGQASADGRDGTTVAALPRGDDDDEVYRNAYEFILSGDYDTAEAGFRDLIARYPDSEHAADAHFWLGEALLAQQKPREAAETFLAASRDFPQARKAPDTLFKLGVSLVALNQRDVACATFSEVLQRYPQATDALKERVKQEQASASC